ncbi:TPA: MFS transporter [Klebsiella pneumoniae]|nr:MFS transporter [Klebsiella pneumoniae]HBQ2902749.1 MFS transporter [Klebsiella pneumoniae]
MSRIDTLVCTDARKTKYRFVVLTMIFLVYAINYADRTNIGAVLPFIIDEFHINNFEAGAIASMFFLGYAVSQIPAGVYIAATMFAPIIVPPLAVWIAVTWGWRWVFFSFAIPGIVAAIAWYLLVKSKPAESGFVSQSELAEINAGRESHNNSVRENILIAERFTWLDKIIRVKKMAPIDTAKGLFTSKNILGDCLAYFMMVSVLYGLLTWIPLYLVKERGFDVMSMGFVASMPCIGGFIGAIGGGWISDKLLGRRRKPTMMFTAVSTVVMMLIMLNIPASTLAVCIGLFFVGFCLNIGWPAFTAYGMAVSDSKTYPIASSIINSGGNLGGFVAPMAAGFLLDKTGSFNSVFTYFGICAAIGLVVILFLDEPQ